VVAGHGIGHGNRLVFDAIDWWTAADAELCGPARAKSWIASGPRAPDGAQLVRIGAYDPGTIAATTLLLMMTAAIPCWIPARRAARVHPVVALRYH
jgi:hypothetical protein